jgi:hypothetical protein
MVLRPRLVVDAPYMLESVVDHGRDNPAESFVAHTSYIGLVDRVAKLKLLIWCLFPNAMSPDRIVEDIAY